MKKLSLLFMALVATISLWASNVITYKATSKLTEVTEARKSGLHTNAFNVTITSHEFADSIGIITFAGEVTSIGDTAFNGCHSLTSVTIPNSVTSIGNLAFRSCTSLSSITIPNSVTSIGRLAFYWCYSLTSITIPNSVTSIGDDAFYFCSSLSSIDVDAANTHYASVDGVLFNYAKDTLILYPKGNTRTSYTIPNSVTSIGNSAFYYCSKLTSITIPNSVTSIGNSAFYDCTSLSSVTIGNSVTSIGNSAFYDCSKLTSLTIPDSVTSIGYQAFYGCTSLNSVTIGNSVTSIGGQAFDNCTSLSSVTIDNNYIMNKGEEVSKIFGEQIKTYSIGNSVTIIGKYAFAGCHSLTSVTIGNSVTSIGYHAFYWCASLKSITIPNSVTSIGDEAFSMCSSLDSVNIGNSVANIGYRAFYCSLLSSINVGAANKHYASVNGVLFNYAKDTLIQYPIGNTRTSYTIPDSVTSIGDEAFYCCYSLTSVTIPNKVTSIGRYAFYSVNNIMYSGSATYDNNDQYWGAKCMNGHVDGYLVYKDTTKTTLCGCSAEATGSITIPNSVTSIGAYAFFECFKLTSITIPNSVTSIGQWAFHSCTSLSSVTIGNSVTSIGNQAFYWCDSLTSITCYAVTPPTCGYNCFVGVNESIPLYIPVGSIDTYKAANQWQSFANMLGLQKIITTTATNGTINVPKIAYYLDTITLSAIPNYGYHFTQWSDGNTDNPRSVIVTKDTTFEALFDKNSYTITTLVNNSVRGTTIGDTFALYLDTITITAFSNYGYHFVQWADGIKENPRSVIVTQDTAFEALFDNNEYIISTTAINGTIEAPKNALYLDTITLTAKPDYGHHFTQWSDGIKDNPRSFVITQDTTFEARFDKNRYTITLSKDEHIQSVSGNGTYSYLDEVTISAEGVSFYQFDHWSDGNTDNPRTLIVTQDTSLTAFSSKIRSGQCGDDLTWQYNNGTLIISGTGAMYNYTQDSVPWLLFRDSITSIVIDNGATSIGDYAFYGCANKNLKKIDLPNSVTTIGQYAFANCTYLKNFSMGSDMAEIKTKAFDNDQKLLYITCYAFEPPTLATDAFANWDAYLSVPCEAVADYKVSVGWKLFNKDNITCIGAEPTTTTEVIVTPNNNSVTITWPTTDGADSYTIIISKGGEPFCLLTFNADGQLTNIAFMAPGRGSNNDVTMAEAVAGGYRFTITSLTPGTEYNYVVDTQDASGTSIANYTGSFTTITPTALPQLPDSPSDRFTKIIKDGQLLILRDGKTYNAQGGEL